MSHCVWNFISFCLVVSQFFWRGSVLQIQCMWHVDILCTIVLCWQTIWSWFRLKYAYTELHILCDIYIFYALLHWWKDLKLTRTEIYTVSDSGKMTSFLCLWQLDQLAYNYANSWQKCTPRNLKQKNIHRPSHLIYMFTLYLSFCGIQVSHLKLSSSKFGSSLTSSGNDLMLLW